MSDAVEKAKKFLNEERAFRLGELLTESSHPKTRNLSETARADLPAAVRLLQSVDEEIPPVVSTVLEQDVFQQLVAALVAALSAGKRVFFTGCGATGRLSILLEAAWRQFWHRFKRDHKDIAVKIGEVEDSVISIMAGGDFALIKSVEGFEDFPDFGRYQLKEAGVRSGDVVIAITEGGETPFVIGTAWEGLDTGAEVFFVYNNPTQLLRSRVQRSREVIEEPRIRKLDLTTGPMAITGSTRMQAVTAELLVVGAALENALIELLEIALPTSQRKSLIEHLRPAGNYHGTLVRLLDQLSLSSAVVSMVREIEFEEAIYRQHGLVTYAADSCLLDVLTDTTERSPTFMVPAFRQHGDTRSAKPWAFVKNPFVNSREAWRDMLHREPRGLQWGPALYKKLKAPPQLQSRPPRLDNDEVHKFRIGNEPDPSRTEAADSALVAIAAEQETNRLIKKTLDRFGCDYKKTAVMTIGASAITSGVGETFELVCDLPCSPLRLWHHLAVKLILNTISTATMVRMGRVVGNAMVWLSPSNKKLIDRGSRLISQVTGCSYEHACIVLHQAMEEVGSRLKQADEVPSPVALAIERIQAERAKSS
jgi:N-acetylmuramic acid 6-phosphate etherase